MIKDWIRRDFSEEQLSEILEILSENGTEGRHKLKERIKHDAVMIPGRSLDMLLSANSLAIINYRDVLISENINKWVIKKNKKYKPYRVAPSSTVNQRHWSLHCAHFNLQTIQGSVGLWQLGDIPLRNWELFPEVLF